MRAGAYVRARVRLGLRASVRARERLGLRASVRADECACADGCAQVRVLSFPFIVARLIFRTRQGGS